MVRSNDPHVRLDKEMMHSVNKDDLVFIILNVVSFQLRLDFSSKP